MNVCACGKRCHGDMCCLCAKRRNGWTASKTPGPQVRRKDKRSEAERSLTGKDKLKDIDRIESSGVVIDTRQPCPDLPGSPLKTLYLREREASGLPLYHPGDCRDADTHLPSWLLLLAERGAQNGTPAPGGRGGDDEGENDNDYTEAA